MPYFGQERMLAAAKKPSLASKKYREALVRNHRLARGEGIDAVMKKYRLDALIVPSGGPVWPIDLVNGDAINWDMESSTPPAVAGYPHITVPAGYVYGLPVGLSFISLAWREPLLIKFAYAFEQISKVRKPPQYLSSVNLSSPQH